MSDLVERTCQVRVAQTPKGPATFYCWSSLESFEESCSESQDEEMRIFAEGLARAVPCGQPAFDYVEFGSEHIWMCIMHFAMHQGTDR